MLNISIPDMESVTLQAFKLFKHDRTEILVNYPLSQVPTTVYGIA
jgi:hypothetical protein